MGGGGKIVLGGGSAKGMYEFFFLVCLFRCFDSFVVVVAVVVEGVQGESDSIFLVVFYSGCWMV